MKKALFDFLLNFNYSLHQDAKNMKVCKIDEQIPQWKLVKSEKANRVIPKVDPVPSYEQSDSSIRKQFK